MRRILVLLAASVFLCAIAHAQDDSPSLGDVARQARAQRQQKDSQPKDASTKDTPKDVPTGAAKTDTQITATNLKDVPQPKTAHVITNEELPAATAAAAAAHHQDSKDPAKDTATTEPAAGDREAQAEQWKSQIQAQKENVTNLQREIAELSDSIHYAGGNCVANCVEWNERQQQKQAQVDGMKAQLEEQQHRLEEMQDSARKQGFGSSVYEP